MFNPHNNKTADGVVITLGLQVFTNELEIGRVTADNNDREFGCCQPTDFVGDNALLGTEHLTMEQVEHLRLSGQVDMRPGIFTNHQFKCEVSPYVCNHNHWFTVETTNGTKSFDGERLATVFEGRRAEED